MFEIRVVVSNLLKGFVQIRRLQVRTVLYRGNKKLYKFFVANDSTHEKLRDWTIILKLLFENKVWGFELD